MNREKMIAAAKEWTQLLFTDGQGRKCRRLVMEFHEGQFVETGWSALAIHNHVADFAIEQVKAERKRIMAELMKAHIVLPVDVSPEDCDICRLVKELEAE